MAAFFCPCRGGRGRNAGFSRSPRRTKCNVEKLSGFLPVGQTAFSAHGFWDGVSVRRVEVYGMTAGFCPSGSVQIDFPVRFSGVRMEDFSSFPDVLRRKSARHAEKKVFLLEIEKLFS